MKKLAVVLIVLCLPVLLFARPWKAHVIFNDLMGAWAVSTGDIDNDGDIDVLGVSYDDGKIAWMENDGTGLVWTEQVVANSYNEHYGVARTHIADVDSDGDLDFLTTNAAYDNFQLIFWENSDGTGEQMDQVTVNGNLGRRSPFAADIDGDNDMDLLSTTGGLDDIHWHKNVDGAGQSWTSHSIVLDYDYVHSVVAADIDNDGDNDVVSGSDLGVDWWENTSGDGSQWSRSTIDSGFLRAKCVQVIDMDDDGDLDVLGAAKETVNGISWWANNGTGTSWVEHSVDSNFLGANRALAVDLDADGDLDVVGCANEGDEVSWWENDGTNVNWTKHVLDDMFERAWDLAVDDIDDDGDLDVIAASIDEDKIVWWEQPGTGSQPPCIILTLSNNYPAQVPQGGAFYYDAELISNLTSIQYPDIWTMSTPPSGPPVGPIWQISSFPLAPNSMINAYDLVIETPGSAPVGVYTFTMKVGSYPSYISAEDSFQVEIVSASAADGLGSTEWRAYGHDAAFGVEPTATFGAELPQACAMSSAYPNPFNPTTTVTVALPDNAEMLVHVFNALGQEVAVLADGHFSAGQHQFTFDGSGLSSGIYMIHTSVPGQLNDMQKVVLLK